MPTDRAYVWVWLPSADEPVVAGRIDLVDGLHQFVYARSYLDRPEAVSLYRPELPLGRGPILPRDGLDMAGTLWDASPDAWGQRVINLRWASGARGDASARRDPTKLTYLLASGSNRIGALDFQTSATEYVPRDENATLDEMHAAAQALDRGELTEVLTDAFVHGTSVGGARPKVLVRDGDSEWIAKLSTSTDTYPVVKAEAVAMSLARAAGVDAARTELTTSLGRDVLLVERFDRPGGGRRRMMVSALTMQGFGDFLGARYSSYPRAPAGPSQFRPRRRSSRTGAVRPHRIQHRHQQHRRPRPQPRGVLGRRELELTPAYDLCPQLRSGTQARQAMDITSDGGRDSRFALCVDAAAEYGLSTQRGRDIVDEQVTAIHDGWDEAADAARLTSDERRLLWRRQILNPHAFT